MKFLPLVALVLTFASPQLRANSAMSPTVIEKVRKSCVEVLVDRQLRGGGAIVKTSGGGTYVITAAHLFPRPNAFITVMTEGYGKFNANLIAFDFGHDLALLRLNTERALPRSTRGQLHTFANSTGL